jgi:hypothetical protein
MPGRSIRCHLITGDTDGHFVLGADRKHVLG